MNLKNSIFIFNIEKMKISCLMKKELFLRISLVFVLITFSLISFSQALLNNGGYINAVQGSYIYVNGSVENQNAGQLSVGANTGLNAELYVTGDITNDALMNGNGHIRLLGDWFNNNIFTAGTGTVFFEGADQLLSGTVETAFYNLTLDGSGLKTQTIDKSASGILDLKHLELQTETYTFFMENTNPAAITRTTGFVSSLNGGKLSRKTNTAGSYLFPVGSSLGELRYRPVEISPDLSSDNTYTVRFANLESTDEGYNISNLGDEVCQVNPEFYHQIGRSAGTSSADINIFYDEAADGEWEGISNWNVAQTHWDAIEGSYTTNSTAPFSVGVKADWDDFSSEPYTLYRNTIPVTFDEFGPYCLGESPIILPTVSNEGISGTWSPSMITANVEGTSYYVFTPGAGYPCAEPFILAVEVINCCNIVLTTTVTDAPCHGENGQIAFSSTGGNPPISYTVNGVASISPFSGPAGTYTIVVTDFNGCTESASVTISQPMQLQVFINPTAAECGGAGGSLFASIVGGIGPYDFLWSNTQTGNNIHDLDPGDYSVIVTDDHGCTATNSATVGISGTLSPVIQEITPVSCAGLSDASLQAECQNSVTPNIFEWNDGSTNEVIDSVGAGQYMVTVTDSWGCTGFAGYTVSEPSVIEINSEIEPALCYSVPGGSIHLNVSGGTGSYTYTWSNEFDGPENNELLGGLYYVSVYDANNCIMIDTFEVGQPEELILNYDKHDISCYGFLDGGVVMSAEGGTPPYIFSLMNDTINIVGNTHTGILEGTYTLFVEDYNSCTVDQQISFVEPSELHASYFYENPSCRGNNDGYIELIVSGGTEPYLFSWDNNTVDIPIISSLLQGYYNVSIVDANNCSYELETISLVDVDEDCLRIPNAFTPNSDGTNDTWIIENLELFSGAYVFVYNRWGQELYKGRPGEEWDGKFNGKYVPAGTYLYVIELYDGTPPYTGTVTVVY